MAYETRFAIRVLSVPAAGWTDIKGLTVLPIHANSVIVFNGSAVDVVLRTDPSNANSAVTISSGQYFPIGVPDQDGGFRFPQNCPPVASLQSTSGTVNVIIESLS